MPQRIRITRTIVIEGERDWALLTLRKSLVNGGSKHFSLPGNNGIHCASQSIEELDAKHKEP